MEKLYGKLWKRKVFEIMEKKEHRNYKKKGSKLGKSCIQTFLKMAGGGCIPLIVPPWT